jgi:hypothetical protein
VVTPTSPSWDEWESRSVAKKTRRMPSVEGWVKGQSLTSVGRERGVWTRREFVALDGDDAREEGEGEREEGREGAAW